MDIVYSFCPSPHPGTYVDLLCLGRSPLRSWSALGPHPEVQFSCSVVSHSLRPHGMQHIRSPCPSPIPGVYSNSCPSLMPSNHLILCHSLLLHIQSFPASGSFQMSQFFALGGQSIGVSASTSVLPMNIQD